MSTIELPTSFTVENLMSFLIELDEHTKEKNISIIISTDYVFYPPLAIVAIGAKIRYLSEKFSELRIDFIGREYATYLERMGFFRLCDTKHNIGIENQRHGKNFFPVHEISEDEIVKLSGKKYAYELGDLIETRSEKIAISLLQADGDNEAVKTLTYCIREIFRNVFEHSQSDKLFFCANYFPKSNIAEFAVADFGCGIQDSLSENPNFRFDNDKDSIYCSLMPSASGKTHLKSDKGRWANSGYGLFMASRFARRAGNFLVASNSHSVYLSSNEQKKDIQTSFPGTFIRLNFEIDKLGQFRESLDEFKKDGIDIARNLSKEKYIEPSTMSLMLRADFFSE